MKRTQITAIKRICKKTNGGHYLQAVCIDPNTNKTFVTNGYCLVRFNGMDSDETEALRNNDAWEFRDNSTDELKAPSIEGFFTTFNDEFHEFYSEDSHIVVPVEELIEESKRSKKDGDSSVTRCGVRYNPHYMRYVCEAIGTKEVSIFFPTRMDKLKPIIVQGVDQSNQFNPNDGLVMPMRF